MGIFRGFSVAFSWLFRGFFVALILRVLALEKSSDFFGPDQIGLLQDSGPLRSPLGRHVRLGSFGGSSESLDSVDLQTRPRQGQKSNQQIWPKVLWGRAQKVFADIGAKGLLHWRNMGLHGRKPCLHWRK